MYIPQNIRKYHPNGEPGVWMLAMARIRGYGIHLNKLRIVPWQPFPGKIDSQYTEYMLKVAERVPASNIDSIKFQSLGPLGVPTSSDRLPPSMLTRKPIGSFTNTNSPRPVIYHVSIKQTHRTITNNIRILASQ
jgi:hypothetical protein